MRLDKMTVNIRPVNAYEAIDLGLAVARSFYWDLLKLWLSRVWIFFVPMVLYLVWDNWGLGSDSVNINVWFGLILWWLKPYYELPMLAYLSQKLFDDKFGVDDTKSVLFATNAKKTTFAMLTRHRFSLKRCSVMAVRLLEGQTGKAMTKRMQLLSKKDSNAHTMHTWVFCNLELVLYFGAVYLLMMIFSSQMADTTGMDFFEMMMVMPLWLVVLSLFVSLLVMGFIAPFFVASGFVMYLCKRSLLEAWDIELIFRKLALRYTHQQTHQTKQPTHPAAQGGGQ